MPLTDETVRSSGARLLAFLQGSTEPAIRAKLRRAGLTKEISNQAWSLYDELRKATDSPDAEPDPVLEATRVCEAFTAGSMIRGRAMMLLSYPAQADYLFRDLENGKGAVAVLSTSTFLARAHELASGADRKATRKPDHDALTLLDQFGITKAAMNDLRKAVAIARSNAAEPMASLENAQRDDVLRRMHAWLTAWTDVANTLELRRDQKIRLGIARRRPHRAKAPVVTPPSPAVTPAPVAPPSPSPVVSAPAATPAPIPVVNAPAKPPVAAPPAPAPSPTSPSLASLEEESGPQSRAA